MDALEIYREIGGSTTAREREEAAAWMEVVRRIDSAPARSRVAEMRAAAAAAGMTFGTVRRRYYAFRGRGAAALLDGRGARRGASSLPAWIEVYRKYSENDKNTSSNGWRRMLADFRAGREMPFGIGTWREVWARERPGESAPDECPPDWIPCGASYANLQKAARRDPDYLFQLISNRRGMRAAHPALLPVLTTRRGLPVGAVYEWDDVWHNIDIMLPSGKTAQPLEFAGYDVASAFKIASCMKPRFSRADGTRCNLTERQFRYLFGFTMCVVGFHRGGVRNILEHGTTAIRAALDRQIRAIPGYGELITHAESGILSEQVHAGLFEGGGGGNFRSKALIECAHNILHDREASLPGNRGRDAEHMHESRAALVRYEERLAEAVAKIDPCAVARIESGLMSWTQYGEAFARLEAALMDDPVHRLEGWDGREVAEYRLSANADWRDAEELLDMGDSERAAIAAFLTAHPECRRRRYMTRREVWRAGQRDFVRVPLFEMPAFLDDGDAAEFVVRDSGLIGISSELYFGRDEMLYRAEAKDPVGAVRRFAPGTRLTVKYNPLCPEQVWIIDRDSGATLGTAPLYNRAPVYDRAAVEAAMGAQSHDLARKVMPVRGRHQEEAEERAARVAANAGLLRSVQGLPEAPQGPCKPPAGVEPATLEELAGAKVRPASPAPSDAEAEAAFTEDFLSSISR